MSGSVSPELNIKTPSRMPGSVLPELNVKTPTHMPGSVLSELNIKTPPRMPGSVLRELNMKPPWLCAWCVGSVRPTDVPGSCVSISGRAELDGIERSGQQRKLYRPSKHDLPTLGTSHRRNSAGLFSVS